jgi:hypothetical protein
MCGMNLVASAYYCEWMLVATTNADRMNEMTRAVREMADSQRDSYRALTLDLAAAQRRGVGSNAS